MGEKTARAAEYDCADRIWCSLSCSTSFARVIICVPLLIFPVEHTSNCLPTCQKFLKLAELRRIRGEEEMTERRAEERWEEQGFVPSASDCADSAAGSWMNAQD